MTRTLYAGLVALVWLVSLSLIDRVFAMEFVLASGVTTNSTTTPMTTPPGPKSLRAEVGGTGAVTGTIIIYGDKAGSTGVNGDELCRFTFASATAPQHGLCPVITAPVSKMYVNVSNLAGAGATVELIIMY